MQTASLRPDHFKDVLGRLPPAVDLDALALETNAVERWREIKDGASLLRLALARGPGGLSLAETAGWAGLIGLAELSAPGLKYRLDKAGGFLDALVSDLLLCAMHSTPLHWLGRFLRAAAQPTAAASASAQARAWTGACMASSIWAAADSPIWNSATATVPNQWCAARRSMAKSASGTVVSRRQAYCSGGTHKATVAPTSSCASVGGPLR